MFYNGTVIAQITTQSTQKIMYPHISSHATGKRNKELIKLVRANYSKKISLKCIAKKQNAKTFSRLYYNNQTKIKLKQQKIVRVHRLHLVNHQ